MNISATISFSYTFSTNIPSQNEPSPTTGSVPVFTIAHKYTLYGYVHDRLTKYDTGANNTIAGIVTIVLYKFYNLFRSTRLNHEIT